MNAQKKSGTFRIVFTAVSVFLICMVAYYFIGQTEYFKGELIEYECNAVPATEIQEIERINAIVQNFLQEDSSALKVQKELLMAQVAINEELNKMDFRNRERCGDGVAFIDEVLNIPEGFGICIHNPEDIPQFLSLVKDNDRRTAVKKQIAVFTDKLNVIAELPQEEQQKLKEIADALIFLLAYEEKRVSRNYCGLRVDIDLGNLTAQVDSLVL